jgi:hypothetical protein
VLGKSILLRGGGFLEGEVLGVAITLNALDLIDVRTRGASDNKSMRGIMSSTFNLFVKGKEEGVGSFQS